MQRPASKYTFIFSVCSHR